MTSPWRTTFVRDGEESKIPSQTGAMSQYSYSNTLGKRRGGPGEAEMPENSP